MNKNMQKEFRLKPYRQKLLATSITALCTGLVSTSVTQASDIDIYQEAQSGSITLMFMLDTSSSMNSLNSNGAVNACDIPNGVTGTRVTTQEDINTQPGLRPYKRSYCTVPGNTATNNAAMPALRDRCVLVTTSTGVPTTTMSTATTYRCYDRLTRLRDGMYDLLNGSARITRLADNLVIGLSDYSGTRSSTSEKGRVIIPARPLNERVQLQKQYRRVGNPTGSTFMYYQCHNPVMTANANATPTTSTTDKNDNTNAVVVGWSCPEWTQFRPGNSTNTSTQNTTFNSLVSGWTSTNSGSGTSTEMIYSAPASTYTTIEHRQLLINAIINDYDKGGIGVASSTTNYTPTATTYADTAAYLMGTTTGAGTYSGFTASSIDTKKPNDNNKFLAPKSVRDEMAQPATSKSCSGQGIYVLTDGEPRTNSSANEANAQASMRLALGNNTYACATNTQYLTGGQYTGGWNCISNFAVSLLDTAQNPTKLKMKTAVVGFGSLFDGLPRYNKALTQAQSLQVITDVSGLTVDIANTAKWGIYGQGGYYKGSSSQDIVDSVNAFLGDLTTEIPAVTTGSPTVPRDSLNPAVLQKQAYYPQFQPTPDKTYQLWAGNLKKYNVVSGILKDKNSNNIVDAKGRIVDNYDLWSTAISTIQATKDADENTYGSTKFALRGGAWSQLKLKMDANATVENRKLLTNRIASGTGTAATFGTNFNLRPVTSADLTDATYQNDENRGYLMQLLGYNVNAAAPSTITAATLTAAPELRQIGAVMHSSPLLLTNKGKLTYSNGVLGSDPDTREDYILFGTTQGLLHVVNAKDGQEKFAFVPNEMVERQKQAFQKYDSTSGGISSLYYGVDGPWTAYTEYVIDSSGNLTVGTGKGTNQKGKQIVYGGLRMGGRSYYALDLQSVTDPKLLFQISPDDGKVYNSENPTGKAYSELAKMGESWSKPTIAWVNWGGVRKRVMFVGGGYDAGGANGTANNGGYESDTYNQTNKIGGGVYMFDADDGTPLWWASANATNTTTGVIGLQADNLQYSVVSEIRAEDRDGDGLVDHLYFGDLGGQLFRIDLDNNATSKSKFAKTPQRLLNLHQTVTASGTTIGTSPRFYEMPAFSIYDYAGNTFAVISIGSGNRSRPLQEYATGASGRDYDAVYNIYDKDVAARDLYKSGYSYVTTTVTTADLGNGNLGAVTSDNRNDNTTLVAPYSKKGWFYQFKSHLLQSAKVFATPIALNNRLFVSTFDGSKDGLSGDCGAGVKGESFLNQFCMPYGQCAKNSGSGGTGNPDCTSGDGCSLGAGIQYTAIVDDKHDCDPATETCDDKTKPKPEDGTNNKNYCVSTGNRGATIMGGVISAGSSKVCLIPQRWYVR
ncbi:pilus assembly protein [Acinetobacter junii]|uniref:pilus assembly protein n=1 Tax=Acinetobacter junii TaxID=40215 RepID=UPI0030FAE141